MRDFRTVGLLARPRRAALVTMMAGVAVPAVLVGALSLRTNNVVEVGDGETTAMATCPSETTDCSLILPTPAFDAYPGGLAALPTMPPTTAPAPVVIATTVPPVVVTTTVPPVVVTTTTVPAPVPTTLVVITVPVTAPKPAAPAALPVASATTTTAPPTTAAPTTTAAPRVTISPPTSARPTTTTARPTTTTAKLKPIPTQPPASNASSGKGNGNR